ncbi:MAG: sporulation transcriptional regulator SpoIIID, partial [Acutalibacteraceae bacterium]
ATVRAAAKVFKISKSTVQTDVTMQNGLCGRWLKSERLCILIGKISKSFLFL